MWDKKEKKKWVVCEEGEHKKEKKKKLNGL